VEDVKQFTCQSTPNSICLELIGQLRVPRGQFPAMWPIVDSRWRISGTGSTSSVPSALLFVIPPVRNLSDFHRSGAMQHRSRDLI
jgi:hypothetical protein